MDNIRFFCVLKNVPQLDFEGRQHINTVPIGEQHISYQGSLMCGAERLKLKKAENSQNHKEVKERIPGLPLCKNCERKYKLNGDLAWQKFVNPKPVELGPQPAAIKIIDYTVQ